MAVPLGLREPVHLLPPADTKAGNPSTSAHAQRRIGSAVRRVVRKYAAVIACGLVAFVGMTAWAYFLGWALVRTVEWMLG